MPWASRCFITALLRWGGRPARIEKLRHGVDKLRWRERLGQKNTVRDAMRSPFVGMGSCDVEDWKIRINLSGLLRDFPTIYPAQQLDVGYKRAVFAFVSL